MTAVWPLLTIEFTGGLDIIHKGMDHTILPPAWQILLLGDGSPTKMLGLLNREDTVVDVIEMKNIGHDVSPSTPIDVNLVPSPRIERHVWLRTASGQRLAYAASWWNASQIGSNFIDTSKPIWVNLTSNRAELYREIRNIYFGWNSILNKEFGFDGPLWGRHYIFFKNGQPLCLIFEVFSPYLDKYLGNSHSKLPKEICSITDNGNKNNKKKELIDDKEEISEEAKVDGEEKVKKVKSWSLEFGPDHMSKKE